MYIAFITFIISFKNYLKMFARFAGIAAATSGKRLDPNHNRKFYPF